MTDEELRRIGEDMAKAAAPLTKAELADLDLVINGVSEKAAA